MPALPTVIPALKTMSIAAHDSRPALSLSNVSFSFYSQDNPVLKNISLDIARNEFVILTGPSGCGKSTLAAAMCGHIPHVVPGHLSGKIQINGVPTNTAELSSLAVQASLCQQDPESQLCTLSVCEEVAFGPENLVLPREEVALRVQSALAAVNATHLRDRSICELSGGEKQRIAIASMLAMQPGILVLDEPTSSLDPDSANDVFAAMEGLRRERDIAVIVIEHRCKPLLGMAARMVVMENGAVTMDGTPGEVHGRYQANLALIDHRHQIPFARTRHSRKSGDVIQVRNLRFSYKDREVLRDISFSAGQGEIVGIIGPNGSGKTTFLSCLAGLCQPASGVIRINGRDIAKTRISEIARSLGYVFQNPNHQIFKDTVFDEAVFACDNFGISREIAKSSAVHAMENYGISSYLRKNPLTLSHGEKRRLNMCSILPHDPGILILDEPFIGQDMLNTAIITADILRQANEGKTILVVSHDMNWVFQYCDRVAFFRDGSIVIDDVPSHAIDKIKNAGAFNFLPVGRDNDPAIR
jgi:energy-coupling factor transport system ATP-binding protein